MRRRLRLCFPVLWYCLIWRFSAQTAVVSGQLSDRLLRRLLSAVSGVFRLQTVKGQTVIVEFLSFYERKTAHMFLYFVLAGLLVFALKPLMKRAEQVNWAALTGSGLWAAIDELHQTYIPGRRGQVSDVLVDLTGAALFLGLAWVVHRVRRS